MNWRRRKKKKKKMVEKKARICDVCDIKVSNCNCAICSKDICQDCIEEITIGFVNTTNMFNIEVCKTCNRQFSRICLSDSNIFEDVFKDQPEIRNSIIELIKNVIMLKKVSDDDLPPEEDENISLIPVKPSINPYNPYPYPKKYPRPNPFKKPPYYDDPYHPRTKKWWGLTKK